MGKSSTTVRNPYKTMFKGTSSKVKDGMHRPEGAGNFDNMDDLVMERQELADTFGDVAGLWEHGSTNDISPISGGNIISGAGMKLSGTISGANLIMTGTAGIGTTSPNGTLDVHTGDAGAVTPSTNADDLVIENSANAGMSILTPNTSIGRIFFGSPADPTGAKIQWANNDNLFHLGSAKDTAQTAINSGNDVEAIRIDASQNVGIGIVVPTAKLDVAGKISGSHLAIENTISGASINGETIVALSGATTRNLDFITALSGSTIGLIDTLSGAVVTNSGATVRNRNGITTLSGTVLDLSGAFTDHIQTTVDPHGATLTQTNLSGANISGATIITTADKGTSGAAYVPNIVYTEASEPTPSNYTIGTLLIIYTP